jgi:hypothetical protein
MWPRSDVYRLCAQERSLPSSRSYEGNGGHQQTHLLSLRHAHPWVLSTTIHANFGIKVKIHGRIMANQHIQLKWKSLMSQESLKLLTERRVVASVVASFSHQRGLALNLPGLFLSHPSAVGCRKLSDLVNHYNGDCPIARHIFTELGGLPARNYEPARRHD